MYKTIAKCRRTIVALAGILALTYLGAARNVDVAASIAAVAMGVAASNAYQKKGTNT